MMQNPTYGNVYINGRAPKLRRHMLKSTDFRGFVSAKKYTTDPKITETIRRLPIRGTKR